MSIVYTKRSNSQRIREPLFQRHRTKYKAARSSESENLETNLLKLDIVRILSELDTIDMKVLDKIEYFIGNKSLITDQVKLDDGLSSELPGVDVYLYDIGAVEEPAILDSMDKLSSKMTRLLSKIKRLEIGN